MYGVLTTNKNLLPEKTKEVLPYLIKYNWLYNYQFKKAISDVLNGMDRRTKGKSQMNLAIEDLEIYYEVLENDFKLFFKELKEFVLLEIEKNSLF